MSKYSLVNLLIFEKYDEFHWIADEQLNVIYSLPHDQENQQRPIRLRRPGREVPGSLARPNCETRERSSTTLRCRSSMVAHGDRDDAKRSDRYERW